MSNTNLAIGADIGGTHITAALIDLDSKIIVSSSVKRTHVNAGGTVDEIIKAWTDCITEARQDKEVESICLAIPGPFDYEAGISLIHGQAKYESLYQLNVKDLLAASLSFPVQSIFLENDAACFLQGEVFSGAADKYAKQTVIGITLGTGLGSAVYRMGASKDGDMWRWPFKEGIAEDYICTRWFVKRWKEITGESVTGVREILESSSPKKKADQLFADFNSNLSDFLFDFIAKESPAAIVIGGNIAKAFDWFGSTLTSTINAKHPPIKIVQAILGEEAPLAGAVGSWLQKQKSSPILPDY
jgi:glucokinase